MSAESCRWFPDDVVANDAQWACLGVAILPQAYSSTSPRAEESPRLQRLHFAPLIPIILSGTLDLVAR